MLTFLLSISILHHTALLGILVSKHCAQIYFENFFILGLRDIEERR